MGEPVKVPLVGLNEQNKPLAVELRDAFERVLDSSQFILGPEVIEFESLAAESIGARHAIGTSSGTDALLLSLMTLGIGPGDEVLCPSFTFFATAGAIARIGAIPVFVDSIDTDFNIDLGDAERRITGKTKAIIPVHLFGQAADMDGAQRLAKAHGLAVLEDAAQSMGATFDGQQVGTMGDLSAFSFFPSKNLGGFGDGGMITTDHDDLAKRARILRVHGGAPQYYHKAIGGNFRMDPLHAALLGVKLGHLPGYFAGRRANACSISSAWPSSITLPRADWCCQLKSKAATTLGTNSPSAWPTANVNAAEHLPQQHRPAIYYPVRYISRNASHTCPISASHCRSVKKWRGSVEYPGIPGTDGGANLSRCRHAGQCPALIAIVTCR
ncbi:MAG: hypothetical protein CM1200mP29_07380 [Verrucomicrobiota bacterium]|nr:MAG: hypothetical protein CM1200mP29_07380 [Verrucomicrobiota bacterium]